MIDSLTAILILVGVTLAAVLSPGSVIDSSTENLTPLNQAADELPRRRRGKKTHVSTLFRWTTVGCKGVVLESLQCGGTRCTSREALQRFFEGLSAQAQAGASSGSQVVSRTLAQRQRESQAAGRRLAERGA
jgi:hypothetical protein